MNIIYLCPSLDGMDGWSQYSYDVVTQMAQHANVTVLCYKKTEGIDDCIHQIPVLRRAIDYLPPHPLWVFIDALKIRRVILRNIRSDDLNIVHCTAEGYAMFIPFLKGLPIKTIVTIHGSFSVQPLFSRYSGWLYRKMYKSVDRIISVSYFTQRHLLRFAPFLSQEKIMVVANGVHYEKKTPSKDVLRPFTILTVGGVKGRKGSHHLVRVAAKLREKYDFPFKIVFVGSLQREKPYFQKIEDFISDHKLEDCIEFTGRISQEKLNEYYSKADVFALLSVNENFDYEGYPLVFHEAAMWGIPTIGTFNCGSEDAIIDGKTGYLVHPDQYEDIADIIASEQDGTSTILQEDCIAWAQKNDWKNKPLQEMYLF